MNLLRSLLSVPRGAAMALIGVLLLGGCAANEAANSITNVPPLIRPIIGVNAVLPEFDPGVANQDQLAVFLPREITSYVSRCNDRARKPYDFRVHVKDYDNDEVTDHPFVTGGSKDTLSAVVEIVPVGGGEPVGAYDFEIAITRDSQRKEPELWLSRRLAAHICILMLNRPSPGPEQR